MKTSLLKDIFRIALGAFMILAGVGHLTFQRQEFVNQSDTNSKRFIRLLFQPVLILWVLWSTNVLEYLITRNKE